MGPFLVDLGDPSSEDSFQLPDEKHGLVFRVLSSRKNVRSSKSRNSLEELLVGDIENLFDPTLIGWTPGPGRLNTYLQLVATRSERV